MKRFLPLLILPLLLWVGCDDENDDYDPYSPFSTGRFSNGIKYTKYDLRCDESQDRECCCGSNHSQSLVSELFLKEGGDSFYRTRAKGDHYYGLSFTFPNETTVQLNFSDYEFGEYGMYTDLDHSCTEEMWDGDFFVFASWDPIYLTEKEKEDITLLYKTEPGTLPDWSP